MNPRSTIVGLAIGVILGFLLAKIFVSGMPSGHSSDGTVKAKIKTSPSRWLWPDSLDAVRAAPENHPVVFENDKIRILEVILRPYEMEQSHTHKFPGVMFGANHSDTLPFDIIYYRYGLDSVHHTYFIKDSIPQHMTGSHVSDPIIGKFMQPESLHRIKNLSNIQIDAFRVEFKTDTTK